MISIRRFFFVVVLCLFSVVVYSDYTYSDFVRFKNLAEQGDASAQCSLGYCYDMGQGVEQDYSQAVYWYRKSAEQGNSLGQNNLGYCYQHGQGVEKDYSQAVYWYKKSAEQGNSNAQNSLGYCYQHGQGVEQNYSQAIYWYIKSADQGNSLAQYNLAYCYKNGQGVEKDYTKAVYWYRKSAEQGDADAQNNLAYCYKNGQGVEKDYSQAVYWYKKSAEQGNSSGQNNLAYCYDMGQGVEQNYSQAVYWYKKSADQGNASAQNNLGYCYEYGQGVEKDYLQAVYWYGKAVDQGNLTALNNLAWCYSKLAICYAKGEGVERDFVLAHEYVDKAINLSAASDSQMNFFDCKCEIYAIQGEKDKALDIWNKILEVNPNFAAKGTTFYTDYVKKWTSQPPLLFYKGDIQFVDVDKNNMIDAEERVKFCFYVENRGKGDAYDCVANIDMQGSVAGLAYEKSVKLGKIEAGKSIFVEFPINANLYTENGQVAVKISVDEPMGFGTETVELAVDTRRFMTPMLKVVDYTITGALGSVLEKKRPFDLQLLLQNVDQGVAENVDVRVSLPEGVFLLGGEEKQEFTSMSAGETKSLEYSLVVNQNYASTEIPINISIKERHGKYAENRTVKLNLNQTLANSKIVIDSKVEELMDIQIASLTSEVDKNIPITNIQNKNTFALIIANENYQSVASVPYALNDGNIFREYCLKTLGIPEKQVKYVPNATGNQIKAQISWLQNITEAFEDAHVIFYYAGHGIPDESSRTAYLLPVDGIGSDVSTGYKLDNLYAVLGSIPAENVTVFMDACFSGSKREDGMLVSARGVAIKARSGQPQGKMVVFSAAQGDETAYPNKEEHHGMFTYYLLKKLQDTKGEVTLQELGDYIIKNVRQQSILLNGKSQTPCVTPSSSLDASWREWKLK